MARRPWLLDVWDLGLGAAIRTRPRRDLRGAVALVTGGSRGRGLQLARELADRGARVAICGRDPDSLRRAHDDLEGRGGPVLALSVDLTDRDGPSALVDRVRAEFGPITVLVHNAGRIEVGPIDAMTEADHRAELDLHYWAPLRLAELVRPDMAALGDGVIAFVTSVGGHVAIPRLVPYCASKHALVGLSRGLRIELARDGITVLTVTPGLMNTGAPRNVTFKGAAAAERRWFELAATAPGLSISPYRAARRIVRALERGETELVLGLSARLAMLAQTLSPRLLERIEIGVDQWLLPPPDASPLPRRGTDTPRVLSPWSGRGRRAERQLNQEVP